MSKVEEGTIRIRASQWPAFLYDHTLFDPDNEESGLFKGYLLLRVRFSNFFNIHKLTFDRFSVISLRAHRQPLKVVAMRLSLQRPRYMT